MSTIRSAALAALALGLGLPVIASAASYDAVASYAALPATASPFSYGYKIGSGPFILYDTATTACTTIAGLSCNYSALFNNNNLPAVGYNTTGALINSGTVRIPTDVLFMHPVGANSGLLAGDTIVRFTAPSAGLYSVGGMFEILDVAASGTNVSIVGGSSTFSQGLSGPVFTSTPFGFQTQLGAGGTLDFVVDSAGSYYNDSTGLAATISDVPEPASWALMMVGFGLLGAARRARRPAVAA